MPDPYREPVEDKLEEKLPASLPLSSVEAEIVALEQQLAQKRASLQEQHRPLEQALGKEQAPPAQAAMAPPSAQPPVVAPSAAVKQEAEKLRSFEKNQQIKSLVDLAFQKGVAYAAEVARNLDNAYLIDEFHDTLIDELHKELVARGKLEEI